MKFICLFHKTMKKQFMLLAVMFFVVSISFAQKNGKAKPIIFAVLNDGKTIEPIGIIDKGGLYAVSDGSDEPAKISAFTKTYYKPKTVYRLMFGGADAGSVTVKSSNPKAECSKNLADVTIVSKAKLKGLVMGLATNNAPVKGKGFRRMPTPAERSAVDSLVRSEFIKQEVSAKIAEKLNYLNLTALDVDNDGNPEFVGTYWAATGAKERATMFVIAEREKSGKYNLGYTKFKKIPESEVMNEDITSVDKGIYQELLLDVMEYDGDTSAEIFTYIQGFEGASFNTYSRREGKWVKVFEGANYHCGY